MKNLLNITTKDVYTDEYSIKTAAELVEEYTRIAEDAHDVLLVVRNSEKLITHVSNEKTGAAVTLCHQLRAAKITKNGTRLRSVAFDYENGAEVYRVTDISHGWTGSYTFYFRVW